MIKSIFKSVIFSVVINMGVYLIGKITGILSPELPVTPDGQPFSLPPLLMACVLSVLAAFLVYWLLQRFIQKAKFAFTVLSSVLLVASFVTPFSVPNISLSMAMMLNLMHVVVAASVLYFVCKNDYSYEK
ncbi:MAG: DUF6069 family protein [Bacteroidota bacterium]